MIMRGSSMPKAEYDLMAIMYFAYGTHHNDLAPARRQAIIWTNDG